MRPQQQNRRMRGRGNNNNNNNRKGPNPLTRSYESNGPDVKIRGTAQQVAEKYATLARDAQSSGDRVMAENYLQHAEHYNRIIAAAQAAQQAAQQQQRENNQDDSDDEFEASDRNDRNDRFNQNDQRRQHNNGSGPQPVIEGVPAEVAHSEDNLGRDKGDAQAKGDDAQNGGQNGQHMNGDSQASGDSDQPRKRGRRPRKPRDAESASGGSETEASPAPEAAE
ncbi:MAG: DUF4167 domain-containing protein [Rhizobiaceae bacterium]|nr:DUF4167 domain-containing protein [Rhizobiaceae bacterium]